MDRTEIIILTSIILLLSFGMGWLSHWILHRFGGKGGPDLGELDRLAQELHESEEMRDQAIVFLEDREEELTSQIREAKAELHAAMEGLQEARQEAAELRDRLERQHRT